MESNRNLYMGRRPASYSHRLIHRLCDMVHHFHCVSCLECRDTNLHDIYSENISWAKTVYPATSLRSSPRTTPPGSNPVLALKYTAKPIECDSTDVSLLVAVYSKDDDFAFKLWSTIPAGRYALDINARLNKKEAIVHKTSEVRHNLVESSQLRKLGVSLVRKWPLKLFSNTQTHTLLPGAYEISLKKPVSLCVKPEKTTVSLATGSQIVCYTSPFALFQAVKLWKIWKTLRTFTTTVAGRFGFSAEANKSTYKDRALNMHSHVERTQMKKTGVSLRSRTVFSERLLELFCNTQTRDILSRSYKISLKKAVSVHVKPEETPASRPPGSQIVCYTSHFALSQAVKLWQIWKSLKVFTPSPPGRFAFNNKAKKITHRPRPLVMQTMLTNARERRLLETLGSRATVIATRRLLASFVNTEAQVFPPYLCEISVPKPSSTYTPPEETTAYTATGSQIVCYTPYFAIHQAVKVWEMWNIFRTLTTIPAGTFALNTEPKRTMHPERALIKSNMLATGQLRKQDFSLRSRVSTHTGRRMLGLLFSTRERSFVAAPREIATHQHVSAFASQPKATVSLTHQSQIASYTPNLSSIFQAVTLWKIWRIWRGFTLVRRIMDGGIGRAILGGKDPEPAIHSRDRAVRKEPSNTIQTLGKPASVLLPTSLRSNTSLKTNTGFNSENIEKTEEFVFIPLTRMRLLSRSASLPTCVLFDHRDLTVESEIPARLRQIRSETEMRLVTLDTDIRRSDSGSVVLPPCWFENVNHPQDIRALSSSSVECGEQQPMHTSLVETITALKSPAEDQKLGVPVQPSPLMISMSNTFHVEEITKGMSSAMFDSSRTSLDNWISSTRESMSSAKSPKLTPEETIDWTKNDDQSGQSDAELVRKEGSSSDHMVEKSRSFCISLNRQWLSHSDNMLSPVSASAINVELQPLNNADTSSSVGRHIPQLSSHRLFYRWSSTSLANLDDLIQWPENYGSIECGDSSHLQFPENDPSHMSPYESRFSINVDEFEEPDDNNEDLVSRNHLPSDLRLSTFIINSQSPVLRRFEGPTQNGVEKDIARDLPGKTPPVAYYKDQRGYRVPKVTVPIVEDEDIEFDSTADGENVVLGQGTFGTVEAAKYRRPDGRVVDVAVKKYRDCEHFSPIMREAKILQLLNSTGAFPTFYGFVDVANVGENPILCLVSELFGQGKTLSMLLSRNNTEVTETGWIRIAFQLVKGMRLIHRKRVRYNDLKPNNVLADTTCPDRPITKYIDAGLCTFRQGANYHLDGEEEPFYFLAPEARRGRSTTTYCDLWSLGAIFRQIARRKHFGALDAIAEELLKENPRDRLSLDRVTSALMALARLRGLL